MSDSDKPGSALEAVEAAAAEPTEQADSSSAEEQPQPEESAEAAPTEQASEGTESDAGEAEAKGPIPYDRHKSVLTKARKEAEEVQRQFEEYKARVAWAEQVDQQEVNDAIQRWQALRQSPIEFYQALGRELEAHPHLGPQMKQPQEFKLPEASLRSEDGQLVYNVEQLQQIREHDQNVLRAEMAAQIQEIQGQLQQQAQIEQQRQIVTNAATRSQDIMTRLRAKPHFKENEEAIREVFAAMPAERVRQIGAEASVIEAYQEVLLNKVIPGLKKASKAETLDTLHKKAAAGTVDPSSAGADAASRPRNVKDLEALIKKQSGAA